MVIFLISHVSKSFPRLLIISRPAVGMFADFAPRIDMPLFVTAPTSVCKQKRNPNIQIVFDFFLALELFNFSFIDLDSAVLFDGFVFFHCIC